MPPRPRKLDIKVTGVKEVNDTLALARWALGPRATLRGATTMLLDRVRLRFRKAEDAEGKPHFGRPAPSKASIKRQKRGVPAPNKTLFDRGVLYRALRAKYSSEYAWTIDYDSTRTTDKKGHDYAAKFLKPGSRFYWPFLGINNTDDSRAVVSYLNKRIATILRGGK